MNKLSGIITKIQQSGAILLVDVDVDGHGFSAMLIESATQPEWLQEGNSIDLVFKETEVSLAKNLSGLISMRNRMKCTLQNIERGELLLQSTKGEIWRFEADDNAQWRRIPDSADPLLLTRQ